MNSLLSHPSRLKSPRLPGLSGGHKHTGKVTTNSFSVDGPEDGNFINDAEICIVCIASGQNPGRCSPESCGMLVLPVDSENK